MRPRRATFPIRPEWRRYRREREERGESRKRRPGLFPHQFPDGGLHGLGPDAITLFVGMQEIGHDALVEFPVLTEEPVAEIQVEHCLVVREPGDDGVRPRIELPQGVIPIGAAGKDGQQQDPGRGQLSVVSQS